MKTFVFMLMFLCFISIFGTVSAVQWEVEYTGDKLPDKDGWTIDTNWKGKAKTEIQNGVLMLDTKQEKGYFRYIQELELKPDEGVVVDDPIFIAKKGRRRP